MAVNDDEAAERERQRREREQLSPLDRLYGPPRKTSDGADDFRSLRRTGRVVPLLLRVHPRTKAILVALMQRDKLPSFVVLFEQMLIAYLDKMGDIDNDVIPSDDELFGRLLQERDKRDGL